jgi:hypothetical protein
VKLKVLSVDYEQSAIISQPITAQNQLKPVSVSHKWITPLSSKMAGTGRNFGIFYRSRSAKTKFMSLTFLAPYLSQCRYGGG